MTKEFNQIPLERPKTPLLDIVDYPSQLRELDIEQLKTLADELRHYLLYCAGKSGGHFGAGLGVIELTIALHYVYDTPNDKLVWDVGHQTYPHKVLTGRRDSLSKIRQADGLSGFPKRTESEYDTFGVGHSSTSISAALGMALANKTHNQTQRFAAIIGDGAMTAGMAFEALCHAAHTHANMLVILNDNQMSISENKSGLNTYFSKIWASKAYSQLRESGKKVLSKVPPAMEFARKTEGHMKALVSPAIMFEEIGFNYIGPIDGHDIENLVHTLRNQRELKGPQFLHIMTTKGKGFKPAEEDPIGYHAINKIDVSDTPKPTTPKPPKYQDVFGAWLCDMAENDERLVGITPAMCEGSGMVEFSKKFKDKYYDVAIAEQHAVTLAAGLACEDKKPVVAIYSTFLQRAYDQLIHDVAIQNLDVTFGIDRAGVVGEDGATHAGSFDNSYLRCIPNMVVTAPSDENECRLLLSTAYQYKGPACVRYPRGTGTGVTINPRLDTVEIGKAIQKRHGHTVAILNFGSTLHEAEAAAERLDASLIDMRFIKPLDTELIKTISASHQLLVTIEENTIAGGAGSGVAEYMANEALNTPIFHIGLADLFMNHGTQKSLRQQAGLDADSIYQRITKQQEKLGLQ